MEISMKDSEIILLKPRDRISHLTRIDRRIFDLLNDKIHLRESKWELVHAYWKKYIRSDPRRTFGDFETDFQNGEIPVETLLVAQRKCKRWFPTLGPKNKKAVLESAKYHKQHARMNIDPSIK
jgi:hypothetical protein